MIWWWKRNKLEPEKTLAEKHLDIIENQPKSLLEAFVQYVERDKKEELELSVSFETNGVLTIYCQFANEKDYMINLKNGTPLGIQRNPELMILKLYENEHLNKVIKEFHRMENIQAVITEMKRKVEALELVFKGKSSARAYDALEKMSEIEKERREKQEKYDRHMKVIWFNSPYLAERLHAIYKEFLIQHTYRQTADPVEHDLVAILDNEKLSEQTKAKARSLLDAYKEQKHEKDEGEADSEEQEAHLILSTIEQYYVKGR